MDTIKKHHIRFSLPAGSAHSQITKPTIESRLKSISGIKEAIINFHNNDINEGEIIVEYDLKKCRDEIIERWLVGEGFVLDDPVLERYKRGFINFRKDTEERKTNYTLYSHADALERARKRIRK